MTSDREPVIVKKHCEANLSGGINFMAGFPRSLSRSVTVFCDFDGPVVDVSDRYYSTYRLALSDTARFYRDFSCGNSIPDLHLKLPVLSKEQFWQMKQNRIPDPEIARKSGLTEEKIEYFLNRVVEIVNRADLLQQDKLQPGVSWALNFLRSQGMKIVLVTLRDRDEATSILEQHGLQKLFAGIYGMADNQSAYQNYAQLKTQLLEQAMFEHLGDRSNPSEHWMIGDTEADILAGKAMGISTIGLTCGIRSYQQLSYLEPTSILKDLRAATHHVSRINCLQACG
jgi:phosphoglycolate phosphatase